MGKIMKNGINYSYGSPNGGGGGTNDYDDLVNKPKINNVELSENKTASDLGLQEKLTFDNTPTSGSSNPVTSGGIYTALQNVDIDVDSTLDATSENPVQNKVVKAALDGKQDTLTIDNTPTQNSTNPIQSGAVYTALQNVNIDTDDTLSSTSENPVQNKVVKAALDGKQNSLTFDLTPTENSTNPVTSGGIYSALQNVDIDVDDTLSSSSTNPVQNSVVKAALDTKVDSSVIGDLSELETSDKTDLVSAINEINSNSGSGSGGSTVTPAELADLINTTSYGDYFASCDRWLRFDPTNRRGLVIKGGTYIKLQNGNARVYAEDTKVDLSSYISTNGADYFVYLSNDGIISAYTTKQTDKGVNIGRFHTLCANAGTMTMIAPCKNKSINDYYMVKNYKEEEDPDFYAFYRKQITAVNNRDTNQYDVATMQHPLSGFLASDILPESVFCLSWKPDCLYEDAMVYDKDTNKCYDIYIESGRMHNARSKYNAAPIVNVRYRNYFFEIRLIGKILPKDHEFTSLALGSNEKTEVKNRDVSRTGGHVDTNNRRMISAIGCEDCCGFLWQILDEVAYHDQDWHDMDDGGYFGDELDGLTIGHGGGSRLDEGHNGSRSRLGTWADLSSDNETVRGAARLLTGRDLNINNAPTQANNLVNYSTTEQVIGTWIDGKPIYQKTYKVIENGATKSPIHNDGSNFYGFDILTNGIVKYVTDSKVFVIGTSGYQYIYNSNMNADSSGNAIAVNVSSKYIYLNFGDINDAYVTIQYTKSTD